MNKTGLKTFVFSFGITLSVILGVDRVIFSTPKYDKDIVKIPRKNITLFFNSSSPVVDYLQAEPVQRVSLDAPSLKQEELEIAYNIPQLTDDMLVNAESLVIEDDDIPLQEESVVNLADASESVDVEQLDSSDVPLSRSNEEENDIENVLSDASQVVIEQDGELEEQQIIEAEEIKEVSTEIAHSEDLLSKPIIIKGTRQIIKIDNLKAKQEKQKNKDIKDNNILLAHKINALRQEDEGFESLEEEDSAVADVNQVASLTENVSLVKEEKDIAEDKEEKPKKKWQTMAEKQQEENPWVVARGSKFVKNKQVLKEEFSSELAQDKANIILSRKDSVDKNVKLAVQDNILIPIPKEILNEDNLIPSLGDDFLEKAEKKKTVKKESVKKDGSFLDSIASVFSKENREKAIKRLKEKSGSIIKGSEHEEDEKIQILPTEIRLSFQPNRAEISGQTLRWIQAFAKKTVDEKDVGLEIRIDGSRSFELQQKRLTLLYNILTTNGVAYDKINTLFVDREPNSFVVRAVKMLNGGETKKEVDGWKKYYQKW